jgi:hypothetical protein
MDHVRQYELSGTNLAVDDYKEGLGKDVSIRRRNSL